LQNSPIRIGSIDLHDFEIPQSVRFGGRHRLAVHALAGGKRIVERLGPDDDDIRFRGTFSGPNAESRARAFDNLRLSGEIVWLSWETFRRQVIVKSFVADYMSPWWINYNISCTVARQVVVSPPQASVTSMLAADLSAALAMAPDCGISLSSLQATLYTTNAATTGTADQTQAIRAVGSQVAVIDSQIAQQSAILSTGISADTGPADLGQAYISNVECAHSLAAAVNVRSYVGRIGTNIVGAGI
jgi:hypothetical protein